MLAGLAMGLGVFISVDGFRNNKQAEETTAYYTPSTHYEVSDTASELASYYSSISDSDTGTTLLSKLQSLNSTKRKKTMGYSTIGTGTDGACIYTDYDLNNTAYDSNGQIYGTKVASFYTKTSATSWNREHVWPNSHGGDKVEGDILHTRPTISSENSSRGNSFYVEGMNNSSSGWDPYTAGYDIECRGECARIILYSVVAYSGFSLSDANSHSTSNANPDYMMGNMNTLIKWHFDYSPNVYEMNRNNGAEYLQGNRNPFVDHPEYVAKIWSSFNSTVSSLCTSNASKYSNWTPGNYCNYGSNTPVNTAGISISKSTASITIGSTTTISATSTNSGTINWTTSNSSVASISSSSSNSGANITITGVSAGTATITAGCTINGTQYSRTCTVTVTKVVSSLSKGSTAPTKTTYTAGESFDPTGLTITATYSDSTTGNVTSSVVWAPDPLTAGTTSVTGTFGGKTITITGLTVNAATEPEIIDSNSDLSVGDYVVLRTAAGVGVTGWNNNKDATVSETESEWKRFYVASASSSGFTLKDESANSFIANPGNSNQFLYGSAATCSTDSDGHLICNSRYLCKNGTNYRFYTSIGSYLPFFTYKVPASSSTKTLSSISISTAPTKTTYTAGEYFDPTGLVITRTYSDSTSDTYTYAGHTSEFTFSPTTSTALTTSHTSVTINYGGKSCNQSITVTQPAATSITASVNKTYYVGETISASDITVKDNNNNTVNSFTFANDGYQFTYADASSGGASTNKTFSNSITYGNLKCGLSVNVARKSYVAPSSPVSDVITASDLTATSTSYSNFSNVAKSSSARYAGQSAKNSAGAIQMRSTSPSGLVSTASGGTISSVTITVNSGTNTINVYGKNTAYSGSSDLYTTSTQGTLVGSASSTGTINFTTGYAYVGIRSSGGAIYLTNITITYGSGETAKNVANYIMYADTNGQCISKLTTAVGYIYNMSSSEKTLFQNSDDYVISTARTRLNAWAANQGKVINYSSGTLSNASNVVGFGTSENNNAITLVIIISMVGMSSIGICLYIRKKRSNI